MEGSLLGCWLLTGWVAALAVPGCNKAAWHPRSADQGSTRPVETASKFQKSQGVYSEASLPSPTTPDAAAVWKGRVWTESRLNNSVIRSRSLFWVLQIRPFQRDKRDVLGPLLGSIIPWPTKMYWRKISCWKRKRRSFAMFLLRNYLALWQYFFLGTRKTEYCVVISNFGGWGTKGDVLSNDNAYVVKTQINYCLPTALQGKWVRYH